MTVQSGSTAVLLPAAGLVCKAAADAFQIGLCERVRCRLLLWASCRLHSFSLHVLQVAPAPHVLVKVTNLPLRTFTPQLARGFANA